MNVKIGSNWVFNTENGEACKVLRNDSGRVTGFESAFTLTKCEGNNYKVESKKNEIGGIPLGIIRKGIEMMQLETSGKLVKYSKNG